MKYYPLNLDINNRDCLVIGGGQVGTRKVNGLLKCGAMVSVICPDASEKIIALATQKKITWHKRRYQSSDMQNRFLVIGATNNELLNREIHADAQTQKVLCNIADRPEICNFILPAVVQRGNLVIAVSTNGKSPALAKKLRKELQQTYGEEYEPFLELMGAIRKKLLKEAHAPETHKPLFEALVNGDLTDAVKNNDIKTVDKLLNDVLGEGFKYEALMTEES
jgi:precorrin-2 dehydrogenase / sirohydrochlorin ferrochelatase